MAFFVLERCKILCNTKYANNKKSSVCELPGSTLKVTEKPAPYSGSSNNFFTSVSI